MTWPATVLTTYIAGTTPTIKAADLNAFQSAIVGLVLGTYSHKAIVVDGTGGAVVSSRPGTVRVSAVDSGTGGGSGNPNLPLASVAAGEFGRALVCMGWAVVSAAGVLLRGVNVKAIGRGGTGQYTITFNASASDPANACALVNITSSADGAVPGVSTQDDGSGHVQVQVLTVSVNAPNSGLPNAFTAADRAFQVLLFAS